MMDHAVIGSIGSCETRRMTTRMDRLIQIASDALNRSDEERSRHIVRFGAFVRALVKELGVEHPESSGGERSPVQVFPPNGAKTGARYTVSAAVFERDKRRSCLRVRVTAGPKFIEFPVIVQTEGNNDDTVTVEPHTADCSAISNWADVLVREVLEDLERGFAKP